MGADFVGIVHPCKIYNILTIGSPFLYIGPTPSHVSEIAAKITSQGNADYRGYSARADDVETVVKSILAEAKRQLDGEQHCLPEIANMFSKQALLPRMIKLLESRSMAESQVLTSAPSANYQTAGRRFR
jgi:hypothetical protein